MICSPYTYAPLPFEHSSHVSCLPTQPPHVSRPPCGCAQGSHLSALQALMEGAALRWRSAREGGGGRGGGSVTQDALV